MGIYFSMIMRIVITTYEQDRGVIENEKQAVNLRDGNRVQFRSCWVQ